MLTIQNPFKNELIESAATKIGRREVIMADCDSAAKTERKRMPRYSPKAGPLECKGMDQ